MKLSTRSIIYYNACILSNLLEYKEKNGDDQDIALLKQVSPIAWQHINLYGHYEFNKHSEFININEIIQQLAQLQIKLELATHVDK